MDGQPIRRVLEWLLNRELTDAEMAASLDMPASTYSRHKDDADYPTYEDLDRFGSTFGVDARMLQIAFGYRRLDELILLDDDAMRQYLQQGGGNYLNHPMVVPRNGKAPPKRQRYVRQDDVEAL
jgi:hypothetical protein